MAKLPALPFVRSSITQGWSANRSYREYRQAAGREGARGMRRQDYLRLYGEVRGTRADTGDAIGRPKHIVPSADQIRTRTSEYATGYGTFVSIYQRTRGETDLIHTPFLIKSRVPITPAEAEQRAEWYLEQEEPDVYNRTTLAISYTGTVQFDRRQR